MLGLGAAIQWVRDDVAPAICELLALPADRVVRTIIAQQVQTIDQLDTMIIGPYPA